MKKILKVNYCDFWGDFDKHSNLFINLLQPAYEVEISEEPELLFYSCYGFEHLKYNCYKIFYTGENVRPDFRECDFSLTFDYPDYKGRNMRLPLFRWHHLEHLFEERSYEKTIAQKTKFCCMVVSNPDGKERNEFFKKLGKYKKVDSGGNAFNNIGYAVQDKLNFIQDYKFVMAFENSCYPGYTTEKIIHPMFRNSLPVYWGNPSIETDFNTRSFINVHEYDSFDAAIEQIINIDTNEELYRQYLEQPWFVDKQMPAELELDYFSKKLIAAIAALYKRPPVAKSYVNRTYQLVNRNKKLALSRIYRKQHWYC